MGQTMGWRRSSHCDNGQCVEMSPGSRVWVRDSTLPGQVLSFAPADWQVLVADVQTGRLDRPRRGGVTCRRGV